MHANSMEIETTASDLSFYHSNRVEETFENSVLSSVLLGGKKRLEKFSSRFLRAYPLEITEGGGGNGRFVTKTTKTATRERV